MYTVFINKHYYLSIISEFIYKLTRTVFNTALSHYKKKKKPMLTWKMKNYAQALLRHTTEYIKKWDVLYKIHTSKKYDTLEKPAFLMYFEKIQWWSILPETKNNKTIHDIWVATIVLPVKAILKEIPTICKNTKVFTIENRLVMGSILY